MDTRPTRTIRRIRAPWAAVFAALFAVPVAAASASAEPFLTELEWIHPHPELLRGFQVLYALEASEKATPKSIDETMERGIRNSPQAEVRSFGFADLRTGDYLRVRGFEGGAARGLTATLVRTAEVAAAMIGLRSWIC